MNDDYTNDPGLSLTPAGRRVLLVLLAVGILLALVVTLARRAEAAPLAGNRGGCAPGNKWPRVACIVTNFRTGFVSGTCEFGLWFRSAPTRRTFRLGQAITVWGCEGPGYELFSAPGYPLRIAR
jgi:hypothetical protein